MPSTAPFPVRRIVAVSATVLAAAARAHPHTVAGDPLAPHLHPAGLARHRRRWRSPTRSRSAPWDDGRGRSRCPPAASSGAWPGALVALVLALTWPLADLAAHWSLTALVVQRLLLTLAAAPLLLLATPTPLLAALTRPAPLDACLDFLTRPVVAVATFTVVAVGTLVSPRLSPPRRRRRGGAPSPTSPCCSPGRCCGARSSATSRARIAPRRSAVAAYLFIQSVVPTLPGRHLRLRPSPALRRLRQRPRRAFGISPLVDQQLAGVVAKVATLPVLWSAAWVSLMRAQRVEDAAADGDDGEPLTWAEVERQLERAARAERKGQAERGAPAPCVGRPAPHRRAVGRSSRIRPSPPGPRARPMPRARRTDRGHPTTEGGPRGPAGALPRGRDGRTAPAPSRARTSPTACSAASRPPRWRSAPPRGRRPPGRAHHLREAEVAPVRHQAHVVQRRGRAALEHRVDVVVLLQGGVRHQAHAGELPLVVHGVCGQGQGMEARARVRPQGVTGRGATRQPRHRPARPPR